MLSKALAIGSVVLLVSACSAVGPADIEGECRIFTDPGFVVQGVRVQDARWLAKTQEAGISACGWERPTE